MKCFRSISTALLLTLLVAGCEPAPAPAPDLTAEALRGSWRGVLESPGGELPFGLEIRPGETPPAVILNGDERAPFSAVEVDGERAFLKLDFYDAVLEARRDAATGELVGEWRKVVPEGQSRLPFKARSDDARRFLPRTEAGLPGGAAEALASVAGTWALRFTDESGSEPAQAELAQEGTAVHGTILTPVGDYRFLVGSYEDGLLRLSTFDGAHAFLFHARATEEGTLVGDFWSRDSYHATWVGRPAEDGEEVLPDATQLARLQDGEERFPFEFPDLDGQLLSSEDPRFDGRVVLINIFGSWCPNCNDEAPLLAEWHRRYGPQGLEIVGLAYEFSGDPERDGVMVRRFAERYGIEYPLLLAGTSDKTEAAATLPQLTAVVAYPTTVFVGRDGTVRHIHSGFAGPGTGDHHQQLVTELEGWIERLLAEPEPATRAARAGGVDDRA